VYVFGSTTTGNLIVGNRIGTDANGAFALGNSAIGVLLYQSPGNTVQGNLISGNRFIGVEIAAATASGNQVIGNMIGTNAAGTAAVPNGFDGVFINNAANNTIGGTATGAGNLISGNTSSGIQLFGPQSTGNVIQGNALGLDIAGRPTLPNQRGGIFVNTTPGLNQIGGTAPGQANYGQSRIVYGIGSSPASPSAGTSSIRHVVRRSQVRKPPGHLLIARRTHRPITGGVKGMFRPGLAPKGTLSIRANSPLKGAGPVTEQM
jgi:parallel beta-helix repeat protein